MEDTDIFLGSKLQHKLTNKNFSSQKVRVNLNDMQKSSKNSIANSKMYRKPNEAGGGDNANTV